jgi:hypothetical protein
MKKKKKTHEDKQSESPFEPASLVAFADHVFVTSPREPYSNYVQRSQGLVVYVFGGVAQTWNRKQARVKAAALVGMIDPSLLTPEGRRLANTWEEETDGDA